MSHSLLSPSLFPPPLFSCLSRAHLFRSHSASAGSTSSITVPMAGLFYAEGRVNVGAQINKLGFEVLACTGLKLACSVSHLTGTSVLPRAFVRDIHTLSRRGVPSSRLDFTVDDFCSSFLPITSSRILRLTGETKWWDKFKWNIQLPEASGHPRKRQHARRRPRKPQKTPRKLKRAPGGPRKRPRRPRNSRKPQEAPGSPRRSQEAPKLQEASEEPRRPQKAPGSSRKPREAPQGCLGSLLGRLGALAGFLAVLGQS